MSEDEDTELTKRERIIKEIKSQQYPKRNITFSIDKELLGAFSNDCKENEVKMNQVVEKLILEYLGFEI